MPGRRPLLALVALFVVPLPACMHISARVGPSEPVEDPKPPANAAPTARAADPAPPRMEVGAPPREFAILPRVPGTRVPLRPNTNQSDNGVAQKPPPKPVEPAGGVQPGPFPPVPQPEPPLLAAVREYVYGRPDKAIDIIRTMDKQNQDTLLALMPVLAQSAGADLNNPATVAALVEQLHGIASRLEPKAALKIEKIAFCNDVSGFGRYVPRPADAPYRPNSQAQLYLEVRNLGSQLANDGYLTHVHATVEVRDAHQKLIEQIDPDDWRRRVPVVKFEKRLASRSPLHDFHVLYLFSVPPAAGVYTVTVELRDAAGHRVVKTAPAQFCVAGP